MGWEQRQSSGLGLHCVLGICQWWNVLSILSSGSPSCSSLHESFQQHMQFQKTDLVYAESVWIESRWFNMTPFHSSQHSCYQRIIVLQSTFKSLGVKYVKRKGFKVTYHEGQTGLGFEMSVKGTSHAVLQGWGHKINQRKPNPVIFV